METKFGRKAHRVEQLTMGDFYMWFTLVQMGDLSDFYVVNVCRDGGQLWWWIGEIAWSTAQRHRTGRNKKGRREGAKDYDLQAASLERCASEWI